MALEEWCTKIHGERWRLQAARLESIYVLSKAAASWRSSENSLKWWSVLNNRGGNGGKPYWVPENFRCTGCLMLSGLVCCAPENATKKKPWEANHAHPHEKSNARENSRHPVGFSPWWHWRSRHQYSLRENFACVYICGIFRWSLDARRGENL